MLHFRRNLDLRSLPLNDFFYTFIFNILLMLLLIHKQTFYLSNSENT